MSLEKSYIGPRDVRPFVMKDVSQYAALSNIGIGLDAGIIAKMMDGIGMDAIQGGVTTASITTPIQFLQNWLPGQVLVLTAARKIDELVGITTAGSWEDEEIVQPVMELAGTSVPYGDYTNVPFSSWNQNFERRTIVRFEEGMRVGTLEEARAAKVRVNSGASKRESAGLALEIQRNRVGFYGYNSGAGRTYGFLNDVSLPAYVAVAAGVGGGTFWSTKTYLEIIADIVSAMATLQTNSKDNIDPATANITIAVATSARQYLNTASAYGKSVMSYIAETYPKARVVSAPELDGANGGENVMDVYAEEVVDNSSDGGKTFIQVVPAKFQVLGVAKLAKGYEEAYSNASAGIMCKRPYAVVRRTGI